MRILVSRFAQEIGGAERSFFAHLSALTELGHEVVTVTNLDTPTDIAVTTERVWWFRSRSKLFKAIIALPQLIQAAWLVRKHRIDVINPHSRFSHIVFSLSKPLHKRPVVWKDALEIGEHLDVDRNNLARRVYLHALKQADAIYVLSEDQRRQLLLKLPSWFSADKVVKIPSGLDFGSYDIAAKPAIKREGITLGFISRIHKQKGVQYLLEAISLLENSSADLRAVIVGEGDYREWLEQMSEELGIANKVDFIDFQDDISPCLRSFDIYVSPSLYESWGISVHEARLFGLPIIASNAGALPEQIKDGVSGLLVPPANPQALAEAIKTLAEDEALRSRLGQAAEQSARELGSFTETVEQKLIPLFEKVIKS